MTSVAKSQIISEIVETTHLTKAQVTEAVDEVLKAITDYAAKGHKITLQGFGTFEMKTRAARTARNPSTGLPVEVPAKTSLTFKASKPKA